MNELSDAECDTMYAEVYELSHYGQYPIGPTLRRALIRAGYKAGAEAMARDAAIGAAIQRAAGELPDGYEIQVCVERGAGYVTMTDRDARTHSFDVDADNRLPAEINAAIDAARALERTGE